MTSATSPPTCPSCGRPLAADAPSGQCPACLLRAGLPTPGGPGGDVPDVEAVRAALPQFEVLEVLGQGGMGVVFRARQRSLDRVVALKVLPRGAGTGHGFAERFAREARALARLQHPGIVQVHDFGEAEGFFWLAMEFVDGITLRAAMREKRLSPREALAIVPQICDALQVAHDQGVVHRDIKPENVLLDRQGRVKIADFGLAKLLDRAPGDPALTRADHVMGTPHYMAPEQVEHPTEVDHRADIYSLGVVFYEMLTGELPLGRFAAPSSKFAMDVRLDEIVLRALEKEPERRWQHASEVRTHVTEVAAGPATRPSPPDGTHAPPASEEPPKLLRLAVAGCAVVVGSGLAMSASLAAERVTVPALVFSGLGVAVGWSACLFAAIRIHHAKGRLRGAAWAWVGLALPLVGACIVDLVLVRYTSGAESIAFPARSQPPTTAPEGPVTESPAGPDTPKFGVGPHPVLRSRDAVAAEHRRAYDEISELWNDLRKTHATLDPQAATCLYVPDVADHLRGVMPTRNVRDGSCGLPLADEKALNGPFSTLVLRKVVLDVSGSFATVEGSDGVRTVKARVAHWFAGPSRPGVPYDDPSAFRWSFTAEPIEVR